VIYFRTHSERISLAISCVCFVLAVAFVGARSYGWYEMLGVNYRWVSLTIFAAIPLVVSLSFPMLVVARIRRIVRFSRISLSRVVQLSIAWLPMVGMINIMLTGGF
jgi:hypothetical protein